MKVLLPIVIVVLLIAAFLVIRKLRPAKRIVAEQLAMTLEQKLDLLAESGLILSAPFTVKDLLESWDRAEFEEPGFDLTLVGLGMTEEQEPWRNHCANLWHFDTECIEDHGDYKRVVERMSEMTQGALSLENVQDYVEVEKELVWFSFTFQGKEIKVDCAVDDDWIDTAIFATFVKLLAQANPNLVFVYYDLGGQDCLIGCVTKEQLQQLNKKGVNFVPLS